jgi:hypothetical protein
VTKSYRILNALSNGRCSKYPAVAALHPHRSAIRPLLTSFAVAAKIEHRQRTAAMPALTCHWARGGRTRVKS